MSKPNQLIDAVKTAKSIHNGDYSSLRGKYFVTRDKIEKKEPHHGDKPVKKSRLDQLEGRMDRFEERMDQFEERMDRFERRMVRLEELIVKLTEEMRAGFKQVNARIDNLEKRIDGIDARLDYNGLKKLPVDSK